MQLAGCAFMFPYEDEFACKRPDNLGKCVSSMEAYEAIKNEDDSHPYLVPASKQDEQENDQKNTEQQQAQLRIDESRAGYERYLDANYREMAQLIDEPITPLVNKAEVIEILILAYTSEDGSRLKGERYVNVINNKPKFVLGDYLKKKPVAIEDLFDK